MDDIGSTRCLARRILRGFYRRGFRQVLKDGSVSPAAAHFYGHSPGQEFLAGCNPFANPNARVLRPTPDIRAGPASPARLPVYP